MIGRPVIALGVAIAIVAGVGVLAVAGNASSGGSPTLMPAGVSLRADCGRLGEVLDAGLRPDEAGAGAVTPLAVEGLGPVAAEVVPATGEPAGSVVPALDEANVGRRGERTMVILVATTDASIESVLADVERRARDAGLGIGNGGTEAVNGHLTAISRSYTGPGGFAVGALACGSRGTVVYREQLLAVETVGRCAEPALTPACASLVQVAEPVIDGPLSVEVLADGRVQAVAVPTESFSPTIASETIDRFMAAGWTWTNPPPCEHALVGPDPCTPFFLDLDGRIGPTITFRLAAGATYTAEVSLRPAADGDQRVDAVVVGGPPPP